jgi:hydrogenase-4 component B
VQLFLLSLLLVLLGGVGALLLPRARALPLGAALIAAGCLLGLADAVLLLWRGGEHWLSVPWQDSLPLTLRVDALSAFFLLAIHAIALVASVYSIGYLAHEGHPARAASSTFLLSLLVVSMALVVSAGSMVAFMAAWELMSLSSFFLVLHHHEREQNRRAGLIYFVYSQLGALVLLVGFALLYRYSGELDLGARGAVPEDLRTPLFALFLVGFGSKAGVFPLHAWLPHAHPAAPSHVSALMSGVMIKTGIYGLLRVYGLIEPATPTVARLVLVAGIASGVLGVLYALGQHDLKRLLAYHSVENIGIILLGLGLGMLGLAHGQPALAALGFAGGLLHVLNHALFKSLLFLGAGAILQRTGSGVIDRLGGLLRSMRWTGLGFVVGSVAIAGLPPLNGFVSEVLVYLAGFRGLGLARTDFVISALAILGLALIGGLALACFTKVVGVVFLGEPRSDEARRASEVGPAMWLPMLALAVACAVVGLLPEPLVHASLRAAAAIDGRLAVAEVRPALDLVGDVGRVGALTLAAIAALYGLRLLLYRGKSVRRAPTWGCGYTRPSPRMQYTGTSYAASLLEFFRPLAPQSVDARPVQGLFPGPAGHASHVHDLAEVGIAHGVVRPVRWVFEQLRWMQHGEIHLYLGYILLAIVVLLLFV